MCFISTMLDHPGLVKTAVWPSITHTILKNRMPLKKFVSVCRWPTRSSKFLSAEKANSARIRLEWGRPGRPRGSPHIRARRRAASGLLSASNRSRQTCVIVATPTIAARASTTTSMRHAWGSCPRRARFSEHVTSAVFFVHRSVKLRPKDFAVPASMTLNHFATSVRVSFSVHCFGTHKPVIVSGVSSQKPWVGASGSRVSNEKTQWCALPWARHAS
mmetsp:Transcript_55312/g.92066  ORF Transcript_55312/g.92066 Transcript_55312/m.92066 type:complete len:217 (+) Transcript_55312:87-737(+)